MQPPGGARSDTSRAHVRGRGELQPPQSSCQCHLEDHEVCEAGTVTPLARFLPASSLHAYSRHFHLGIYQIQHCAALVSRCLSCSKFWLGWCIVWSRQVKGNT